MPSNPDTAQAIFESETKQLAVEGHALFMANNTPQQMAALGVHGKKMGDDPEYRKKLLD